VVLAMLCGAALAAAALNHRSTPRPAQRLGAPDPRDRASPEPGATPSAGAPAAAPPR
jgi:hypothetical protein